MKKLCWDFDWSYVTPNDTARPLIYFIALQYFCIKAMHIFC